MNGMRVAVAIGTMLIAFISVIAMFNAGIGVVGLWFNLKGLLFKLTRLPFCSYCFYYRRTR